MPRLTEQKVEIGHDAYGREVTMTRSRTYDGKTVWRIDVEPAGQRDDPQNISGLTDDNVRDMIRALDYVQKI